MQTRCLALVSGTSRINCSTVLEEAEKSVTISRAGSNGPGLEYTPRRRVCDTLVKAPQTKRFLNIMTKIRSVHFSHVGIHGLAYSWVDPTMVDMEH